MSAANAIGGPGDSADELGAGTDYNNALVKLPLATGGLLQAYNIKIDGLRKEAPPWWASFSANLKEGDSSKRQRGRSTRTFRMGAL